jgi:type IV pilus assembly protein PilO
VNEHIEMILDRPTGQKVGILLVSVIFIFGIFWFWYYSPVLEELVDIREKIDGSNGLKVQIAAEKGITKNLDSYLKEVDRLDYEFVQALSKLPDQKEIDLLLTQISDLARDAGLEIRLFKPRTEKKMDYYAEVPVELELTGTYHEMAAFFDEVGHLDRVVNLDRFEMVQPKVQPEKVSLSGSVVATTFRFLSEEERPDPNENANTKGKRRRR